MRQASCPILLRAKPPSPGCLGDPRTLSKHRHPSSQPQLREILRALLRIDGESLDFSPFPGSEPPRHYGASRDAPLCFKFRFQDTVRRRRGGPDQDAPQSQHYDSRILDVLPVVQRPSSYPTVTPARSTITARHYNTEYPDQPQLGAPQLVPTRHRECLR